MIGNIFITKLMEVFSGWEEEGLVMGENILKQLKHNLNNYERSFNDLAR